MYTHHDVLEHAQIGLEARRVRCFRGFFQFADNGRQTSGALFLQLQSCVFFAHNVHLRVRAHVHDRAKHETRTPHARRGA